MSKEKVDPGQPVGERLHILSRSAALLLAQRLVETEVFSQVRYIHLYVYIHTYTSIYPVTFRCAAASTEAGRDRGLLTGQIYTSICVHTYIYKHISCQVLLRCC